MRAMVIVFDCDGTLVDSQHAIRAALARAFARHDLAPPDLAAVRRIVGLSLDEAMESLLSLTGQQGDPRRLAEGYREAFMEIRRTQEGDHDFEPLYEGIGELIAELADAGARLGIATGKSRRGIAATLERHGLARYFDTVQTADTHPSKPHPAMLETACTELGADPAETVLVGDTRFDVEMAQRAGAHAIGVAWGYHEPRDLLKMGAAAIASSADEIPTLVRQLLAGEGRGNAKGETRHQR